MTYLKNYFQRIKCFGAEGDVTTQQHLDGFNDFVDLEEVDHEDVIMRLFAQNFSRGVRKWFKGLVAGSIHNFQEFEQVFLRRWESKKNSLQLLTQYNNLKKSYIETVQEFSVRFMRVCDSISDHVNPTPRVAQLHYADAFDSDFALTLRERRSPSLADMMNDATEVEVNLMASRKIKYKLDMDKKKAKEEAQP